MIFLDAYGPVLLNTQTDASSFTHISIILYGGAVASLFYDVLSNPVIYKL